MLRSSVINPDDRKGRKAEEHLPLYFSEYLGLPRLHPHSPFDQACWYHFHQDLTDNESPDLCEEAKKSVELVVDLSEFLEDPLAYGERREYVC